MSVSDWMKDKNSFLLIYIFLPCASEGCAYFQKIFCLCQAQR